MIFLLVKMFLYIFAAAAIGGGAGWLLRNMQAQRIEEDANRSVNEVKVKMPQMESLLRSRDDLIGRYREELTRLEDEVKSAEKAHQSVQDDMRKQTTELQRVKAQVNVSTAVDSMSIDDDEDSADEKITELSQQILLFRQQLEDMTKQKDDLEQRIQNDSAAQKASPEVQEELNRSVAQAAALSGQLDETKVELTAAQKKVEDLEREQELQNKSLVVLHQQLEIERSRRVANG